MEIPLYKSGEQDLQSFTKKLVQEALHKVVEQSAPIAARIGEFVGVRLLRCKCRIGEMLACPQIGGHINWLNV